MSSFRLSLLKLLPVVVLAAQLGGCAGTPPVASFVAADDQECLARVMYFESNRSSEDGMRAVGTVVMNRIDSGRYPNSVCAVVGQKNQFAQGALTKPMDEGRSAALARRVAGEVLQGQRDPRLAKKVMFFHTAGYHYPYTNMRYVVAAGGNVFYYKESHPVRVAAAPRDPHLMAYASKIAPEASTAFSEQSMAPRQQAAAYIPALQPEATIEQVAVSASAAPQVFPVQAIETSAADPAAAATQVADPAPSEPGPSPSEPGPAQPR